MFPPTVTRTGTYILVGTLTIISVVYLYGISGFDTRDISQNVRIGYFHSDAHARFYKLYRDGYFDTADTKLTLYTTIGDTSALLEVEKSKGWVGNQREKEELFGWTTGDKIAEYIAEGALDGGLIGSGSFLNAIKEGASLVAVMMVGVCGGDEPCRAIVFSEGGKIDTIDDWEGKRICYFRNTSVDYLAVKKYFDDLHISNKVTLVNTDTFEDWLSFAHNTSDACVFHYGRVISKNIEEFVPLDSVDPSMFHTLLVFNKEFLAANKDTVRNILATYLSIFEYPDGRERIICRKNKRRSFDHQTLAMQSSCTGQIAVNIPLLNELKMLMLEESIFEKNVDIEPHVDNSFVTEISGAY